MRDEFIAVAHLLLRFFFRCRGGAPSRESAAGDTTLCFCCCCCCCLSFAASVPARWQAVGTAAAHDMGVGEREHLKRPACPHGPFCSCCLCFYCCGHHGGLMNGGPVLGRTLVASSLRTLLGIARTSGELCSVHVSTASVTLSENSSTPTCACVSACVTAFTVGGTVCPPPSLGEVTRGRWCTAVRLQQLKKKRKRPPVLWYCDILHRLKWNRCA